MIMGILSGIFKSRDKPQNATSGSAYRFFIGGSSSGKNVNERSAMQMTAVYSCVRILSEAVASLPLHVYKYNGDGGKEKAVKHPLYFLLHDEPNPEMTSFVFRETLMTHLLLWGNAYAQIIRNGKGKIIALYPLMPNRMIVDRDDKDQLYYQYNTSKKRYEGIAGMKDYKKVVQLIKDGGYATSLTYVEKLCSIIEKWNLTQYDVKETAAEPEKWYRVRKSWADAKSQKGAYKVLKNAKACADKNEGYSVYDWNGNVVYAPSKSSEPELVLGYK